MVSFCCGSVIYATIIFSVFIFQVFLWITHEKITNYDEFTLIVFVICVTVNYTVFVNYNYKNIT